MTCPQHATCKRSFRAAIQCRPAAARSAEDSQEQTPSGGDNPCIARYAGQAVCRPRWWDKSDRCPHPLSCAGSICRIRRTALPTPSDPAFLEAVPKRARSFHPAFKFCRNRFRRSFVRIGAWLRSEEHTSELQSLMRISYAVFCLKKKKNKRHQQSEQITPTTTNTNST